MKKLILSLMLVISMFTLQAQERITNEVNEPCLVLKTDTLQYYNSIAVIKTYLIEPKLSDYDINLMDYYFCMSTEEQNIQNVDWLFQGKLWVHVVLPPIPSINSYFYIGNIKSVQKW